MHDGVLVLGGTGDGPNQVRRVIQWKYKTASVLNRRKGRRYCSQVNIEYLNKITILVSRPT